MGSLSFALHHSGNKWTAQQRNRVEDAFERFLYEAPCMKVVHNLPFEQEWTAYFFGEDSLRAQPWGCSQNQAFLLDERQGCLSLEFLSVQYFGLNIKKLSNLDRVQLDTYPVDVVLQYNGVDAKYHRLLFAEQAERIRATGMQKVYDEQLRRVPTAVLTQLKGVPLDQKVIAKHYQKYSDDLEDVELDIFDLQVVADFERATGKRFRPTSNPDILKLLRDQLRVRVDSTDETVLRDIDHDFAKLILEHRGIKKLLSTYIEPVLPDAPDVHPDGLLHPLLSLNKTRTNRSSSDSPNVQNWPKRENKHIRRQVAKGGDYRVVSFDYAGIQARNVAMESKDRALIDAFWHRYDIHSEWMEEIQRDYSKWIPKGEAKDPERRKYWRNRAKNGFVFPSFFGAQSRKIATELQIPENIAAGLHEKFWDKFPDIKGWHKSLDKLYRKYGYVTGLSGFRRHAPVSPNERINAPIQADEAIIVFDAMARLSEMEEDRFQANLMVHDDLTFFWHKSEIERNAEVVVKTMLAVPYKWAQIVPIGVEMSVGENWADQKTVGEYFSDDWGGIIEYQDPIH